MGDVLSAEPDDIRVRLINVMAHLTVEDWAFIAKRAKEIRAELDAENSKPGLDVSKSDTEKAGP